VTKKKTEWTAPKPPPNKGVMAHMENCTISMHIPPVSGEQRDAVIAVAEALKENARALNTLAGLLSGAQYRGISAVNVGPATPF